MSSIVIRLFVGSLFFWNTFLASSFGDSLGGVRVKEDSLGKPLPLFFVQLKPGRFQMGSPDNEVGRYSNEVQHEVTLTKGFEIQDALVHQSLWEEVMGSNPSYFKDPHYPITDVSWSDVQEFIKQVNKLEEGKGYVYRLSTEAEWEYSTRGGTNTAYSFGDDVKQLDEYGWYQGNSQGHPHPVASKKPNPIGLYDMHGNVWEWVQDFYAEDLSQLPSEDPQGPSSGSGRVVRGGSWDDDARYLRSADRDSVRPDDRGGVGFRLVRTPK